MELSLVFGLDVPLEAIGMAECLTAVMTLIGSFFLMDSFDMSLEVMSLRELPITLLTTERLLLGVDSDVPLEF